MKKLFYLFFISVILSNCASLTKTQIESVNQFAKTTKDFSAYPSKIMTELADIRAKRGVFYANSLSDPEIHINELDEVYSQKKADYQLSKKVDITFKIIDKYSQSLILLTSDKFEKDFEEQTKNFGINIDSLISLYNSIEKTTNLPTGIGSAVSELIVLGGKQYMRVKQAKEIKNFVILADTLISTMTSNLLVFLQSENINDLIKAEERGITSNYLSYLRHTSKATIEDERDYMQLKSSIDGVKQLQKQTIEATKNLKNTHKKLLLKIQERKNIKQTIEEVQTLIKEIKELKETIEKIETEKTK